MEFKDYYAILGVAKTASHDEIRRAYRKLARKYHPDLSKEANAEERFKEIAEAHEALVDAERRAAYDEVCREQALGKTYSSLNGRSHDFEFSGRGAATDGGPDFSDFFSNLFGHQSGGEHSPRNMRSNGDDHHAKVVIDLEDAYSGAQRMITLRAPVADEFGQISFREHQLQVTIPRGVRDGQHLRLAGQGSPGLGDGRAGDLYLELALRPHRHFRVEGRDVYLDLAVAPWEAALGASIQIPTPEGPVMLTIPPGSMNKRSLRLKGRGIPAKQAGDFFAILNIATPIADSSNAKQAYADFALAFPNFKPRASLEAAA